MTNPNDTLKDQSNESYMEKIRRERNKVLRVIAYERKMHERSILRRLGIRIAIP